MWLHGSFWLTGAFALVGLRGSPQSTEFGALELQARSAIEDVMVLLVVGVVMTVKPFLIQAVHIQSKLGQVVFRPV